MLLDFKPAQSSSYLTSHPSAGKKNIKFAPVRLTGCLFDDKKARLFKAGRHKIKTVFAIFQPFRKL